MCGLCGMLCVLYGWPIGVYMCDSVCSVRYVSGLCVLFRCMLSMCVACCACGFCACSLCVLSLCVACVSVCCVWCVNCVL